MFRSLSMPSRRVPPASPTQQQARRSDGELCFEMKNETGWLANVTESTFCPELSGVNFNDITEDALKKGKAWVKFQSRQEKKSTELLKRLAKEKQMLVKRQLGQMEKLQREQVVERSSLCKSQDKAEDKYAVDETEDQESRHSKATSSLTAVHESESLRLDKIHKTEKFENDKKIMKENHEQFKQIKKEAHDLQLMKYEQYQSMEVMELTKTLQTKQNDGISRLMLEIKDKEELAEKIQELEEKGDKETLIKRKQLGNTQEIRREQLVAEHKEQMKMVDKLYLKKIKEFEFSAQSEIKMIEQKIQELELIQG